MVRPRPFTFCLAAFVFCAPLCALDKEADLRKLAHHVWNAESGLPQNTVNAIAQDDDGYIWLATDAGAVRFDGARFTTFDKRNTPALKSDRIRNLYRDRDGAVWISTPEGLARYHAREFTAFAASSGLPSENVMQVFDCDRTICAITDAGLSRLIGPRFSAIAAADLPAITAAVTMADGTAWLGTNSGLYSLREGASSLAATDIAVHALAAGRDGTVWVGTSNGLRRITNGALDPAVLLPGTRVSALYSDQAATLWAATSDGVVRMVDRNAQPLQDASNVTAFLEDREGSLWFATEGSGVHLVHQQKFTTYGRADGLADERIRVVAHRRDGTTLAASDTTVYRRTGESFRPIWSVPNSGRIAALTEDAGGNLWIGTTEGLVRLRGGETTTFTSIEGLADDFVRSVVQDRHGILWIGTRRGISRYAAGKFTTIRTADGLPSDFSGAIIEARDGNLWIATSRGLARYADGKFAAVPGSAAAITALHESADSLWAGADGNGLLRWRRGKLESIADSQLPDVIYAILEDSDRALWLCSPRGIFRLRSDTQPLEVRRFDAADGMATAECSAGGHPSASFAGGKLWFATLRGLAAIHPADAVLNNVAPTVIVEAIEADGRSMDLRAIEIGAGYNRVAIHYTAPTFVAPQRARFKYKLEGFDRDWIDAGSARVANYTSVPPGRYTFRVLAANNDGVWNETGAALALRLRPHFYQTLWFYFIVTLATAALIYALYRLRLRHLRARHAAVLDERQRIAREIHDTLAQGFVGISVQLELVARMLASTPETAREHLDQARILVRNSLAEARRSIWNLRSPQLAARDFPTVLDERVRAMAKMGNIPVRTTVTGAYRTLPKPVEEELLRIAEEAVTNASRHAGAKHIDIELAFDPDRFRLLVRDDGRGFNVSEAAGRNGHFGIIGMRERAVKIGAQLDIRSSAEMGTTVSVEGADRQRIDSGARP